MGLHQKLFSLLVWASCAVGASPALAVKLNDILRDEGISDAWTVDRVPSQCVADYYQVKAFPEEEGKYYACIRSRPFDSVVLSRYGKGGLGWVLDEKWMKSGFSAHAIIPEEGGIVVGWVDPSRCEAQMAGPWNRRALELLVETDEDQNLDLSQIRRLGSVVDYWNQKGGADQKGGANIINLKFLGDHREARGSGRDGEVTNIDEVRRERGLDPLRLAPPLDPSLSLAPPLPCAPLRYLNDF